MDFRQIGRAIRTNWVFSLVAFVVCVGIGAASALLPAKQYQATALIVANPTPGSDSTSSVAAIQFFLPQLALEAEDAAELDQVAKGVPARYANDAVALAATSDPATGTITVTGNSTDPEAAAAYVNANSRLLVKLAASNTYFTLVLPTPASVPDAPTNPRKEILLASIVLGLIAAVLVALGADAIRRRLNQVEETRSLLNIPVLAEVPRMGRHALHPSEVFKKGAHPLILEAFQEMRSNLLLALPSDRPAAIAVISGDAGEGKSSVASDLAWVLASERRQVTVIDCDLRKPTMHLLLGTALGPGVSGRRTLDLSHLMCATDNSYLNVIPAGIPDRHPVDIISAHLPALLSELRDDGSHVVIDCPPLIGVAETLLVAAMVDVVVLVVDARHYDPAHVQQYKARLEEAGATVIGVVLNRVRMAAKRWDRSHNYAVPEPEDVGTVVPVTQSSRITAPKPKPNPNPNPTIKPSTVNNLPPPPTKRRSAS
jgi:capsular exopolysaccharide synthesis family protein